MNYNCKITLSKCQHLHSNSPVTSNSIKSNLDYAYLVYVLNVNNTNILFFLFTFYYFIIAFQSWHLNIHNLMRLQIPSKLKFRVYTYCELPKTLTYITLSEQITTTKNILNIKGKPNQFQLL